MPLNYIEFIDDLTYMVKHKIIPMERIDDAVGRILLVKFTMGLFENPLADLSLVNELGKQVIINIKVTCIMDMYLVSSHGLWVLCILQWRLKMLMNFV